MRTLVILLGSVLLLEGCVSAAPTILRWSKPGATYQQFLGDRYACILQARANASSAYVYGAAGGAESSQVVSASIFMPCMSAKGYAQDPNGYAPPPGGVVPMSR